MPGRPLIAIGTLLIGAAVVAPPAAQAARAFVAEIEARAGTAAPAGIAALDTEALAQCLRRARELEAIGTQIDKDSAEMDRLAAGATLLGRGIDLDAITGGPGDDDNAAGVQRRFERYNDMASNFQAKYAAYKAHAAAYGASVKAFDDDCGKPYRAGDLPAAKRKAGLP